jgi:thiamine biosynthesis lipoprotein
VIGSQREVRLDGRRFYVDMPGSEAIERFACFGGSCTVIVSGGGPAGTARAGALWAKRRLVAWHEQFSRFDSGSELSRLNRDPRGTVRVSPMMARFVQGALRAATITGGLVDPTLVGEIERAGYRSDFDGAPVPLARALEVAPPRAAGGPSQAARWREVSVDPDRGTVTRPPGVRLDSGGIAKGLFGDVLASELSGHEAVAVEAAGDVRIGGSGRRRRAVEVADPFAGSVLHAFDLVQGAAATSGIDKRSWIAEGNRPAHHLLDPATGMPAFTGIVQATALAPTALEAELRSKAALLSGPQGARVWLLHGGLIVYDDGTFELLEVPAGARDSHQLDARELSR